MSPALIVQCFAVTNDQPLIHTLKFGDVINDDGIYKTPGTFLIVDMSRIIAIAQHTQPQRFVHEIVILESGFEHISRRTGSRNRVSLISQQRLEQFLATMDYQVQDSAGKVSQEEAREKAYGEYEKYKVIQDRSFISDFDRFNNGDKLLPFDINPDKE